mgnify:CR=1 FL=1
MLALYGASKDAASHMEQLFCYAIKSVELPKL